MCKEEKCFFCGLTMTYGHRCKEGTEIIDQLEKEWVGKWGIDEDKLVKTGLFNPEKKVILYDDNIIGIQEMIIDYFSRDYRIIPLIQDGVNISNHFPLDYGLDRPYTLNNKAGEFLFNKIQSSKSNSNKQTTMFIIHTKKIPKIHGNIKTWYNVLYDMLSYIENFKTDSIMIKIIFHVDDFLIITNIDYYDPILIGIKKLNIWKSQKIESSSVHFLRSQRYEWENI